jgi:uncharacterized protein (DUF305 family)
MPGMALPEQIQQLGETSPQEADILFLQLMIPHHQAALQMTDSILERTDRPEIERLAEAISASQQAEIKNMQEMLQVRGGFMPEEPSMDHGQHGAE